MPFLPLCTSVRTPVPHKPSQTISRTPIRLLIPPFSHSESRALNRANTNTNAVRERRLEESKSNGVRAATVGLYASESGRRPAPSVNPPLSCRRPSPHHSQIARLHLHLRPHGACECELIIKPRLPFSSFLPRPWAILVFSCPSLALVPVPCVPFRGLECWCTFPRKAPEP
ncbi:hypothetical protein FB451DRAFT_1571216 [Mycena latifolia]|nr:hypothetical protein FB451DRAFT_1571216 [Mycena latifolia]